MSKPRAGLQIRAPNAQEQQLKERWLNIWQQDRARVLLQHPFTASLALHLDLVAVVDSRMPTAATDGRKIYFNPMFLQSLSADERIFVLAHEVWHCVAGHIERRGNREPKNWNLAVDHEVNNLLLDDGFTMPEMGIHYPQHAGKSAEQVYERLVALAEMLGEPGESGFDQHEPQTGWDIDAQDLIADPDYAPGTFSKDMEREWRQNLVAACQNSRNYSALPGRMKRWIESRTKPTVNWRDLLRQFVQRSYGGTRSWYPPNRRHLYRGLYLPSTRNNRLRVWVAVDTSGSTASYIPRFLTELARLLGSFDRVELTLIECDTEIKSVERYDESQIHKLKRKQVQGFGGTSLMPPFELASKEGADCLVYLTDGFGPAPENPPTFPVLWVMPRSGTKPVEWGEEIRISRPRKISPRNL